MSFKEKRIDERAPLIENPVIWTRSYDNRNSEDYGRAERKQTFQWLTFMAVTIISIFILLATVGFIMRNYEKHPAVLPKPLTVPTTGAPALPTEAPAEVSTTVATTTTTATPAPLMEEMSVSNVTT